ncbi:hypothetical protein ACTOV4_20830 [Brucella sp. C7-11G]|nr:hypothetical protein [Brucella sp. 21LCYQ03]
MTEHFNIETILLDPMIALVNKADGVDQSSFSQLLSDARHRCESKSDAMLMHDLSVIDVSDLSDIREVRVPQFSHLEEHMRTDIRKLVRPSRARRCWISVTDGNVDHMVVVEHHSSH